MKHLPLFFLLGIHTLQAHKNNMPAAGAFRFAGGDTLRVQGDTVEWNGKRLELDQQGFPGQIFTPTPILAENIHFHFTRLQDGKDIALKNGGVHFTMHLPALLRWRATDSSDELKMEIRGELHADGGISYRVKITAMQDLELKEITMHIPFDKAVAKKIKGLGLGSEYPIGDGISFPPDSVLAMKWEGSTNPVAVWIGTANAGLLYLLQGAEWDNKGKGGIIAGIKGRSLLANNYSGAHSMKKGDTLKYEFDLAITPLNKTTQGTEK